MSTAHPRITNELPTWRAFEAATERADTRATIIDATPYPNAILEQIRDKVDDYMDRVLDDYKDFGITVYFE